MFTVSIKRMNNPNYQEVINTIAYSLWKARGGREGTLEQQAADWRKAEDLLEEALRDMLIVTLQDGKFFFRCTTIVQSK
jgi:hypothetical protein